MVQEALARALPRWERISRVENVDAYVRRMVVNAHTSWWRRWRRRESPVAELPRLRRSTTPGDAFDDHRRLWLACQALPEVQRTAVVLRYYEQLEYAEIADLTGVREGSVRARVSRGIAALRVVGWERTMSDLESRLTEVLRASRSRRPDAAGLADAARSRARARRRTRVAAVGGVAVVAPSPVPVGGRRARR